MKNWFFIERSYFMAKKNFMLLKLEKSQEYIVHGMNVKLK